MAKEKGDIEYRMVSARIPDKVIKESERQVSIHYKKYDSLSHYFRVALVKLNRENAKLVKEGRID